MENPPIGLKELKQTFQSFLRDGYRSVFISFEKPLRLERNEISELLGSLDVFGEASVTITKVRRDNMWIETRYFDNVEFSIHYEEPGVRTCIIHFIVLEKRGLIHMNS